MSTPISTISNVLAITNTFTQEVSLEHPDYSVPESVEDSYLIAHGVEGTHAPSHATGLPLDHLQIACQGIFAPVCQPVPVDPQGGGHYDSGNPCPTAEPGPVMWNLGPYTDAHVTYSMETVKIVEEMDPSELEHPSQDGEVSTSTPSSKSSSQNPRKSNRKRISRARSCANLSGGFLDSPKKKSAYKHVPHADKPAHLVAKRNARERKRVHAVNLAFVNLRNCIPYENKRGKRVSKVKVLQRAINYISNMQQMVRDHDGITSENEENTFVLPQDDSSWFDF